MELTTIYFVVKIRMLLTQDSINLTIFVLSVKFTVYVTRLFFYSNIAKPPTCDFKYYTVIHVLVKIYL